MSWAISFLLTLLLVAYSDQQECAVDEGCDLVGRIGSLAGKCVRSDDKFNGNCDCTGWEDRGTGGAGHREFTVTCKPAGGAPLTCVYRGQPHCCDWYNKGNQQAFYDQLLKVIGPNMCQIPIGNCPNRGDGYHVNACFDYKLSYFKWYP